MRRRLALVVLCLLLACALGARMAVRAASKRREWAKILENEKRYAKRVAQSATAAASNSTTPTPQGARAPSRFASNPVPVSKNVPAASVPIVPTCEENLKKLEDTVIAASSRPGKVGQCAALLALGNAYARGCFPLFRPDEDTAAECYAAAADGNDRAAAATARALYLALKHFPVRRVDRSGGPMPTEYGRRACALARGGAEATRVTRALGATIQLQPPPRTSNNRAWYAQQRPRPPVPPPPPPPLAPTRRAAVRRVPAVVDTQSAHDTAVVAGVTSNVAAMRARDFGGGGDEDVTRKIREAMAFAEDVTPEQRADAERVLSSLGDARHGTFDTSEREALRMVWDRVQGTSDPTTRTNMIETLGKQLAACVERDNVVCSTGKIARIVGALDGTEHVRGLRPLSAVREEMGTLASAVRREHVAALPEQQRRAYEEGDLPGVSEAMREDFANRSRRLYVDELRMHESVVKPLTDMYGEGF